MTKRLELIASLIDENDKVIDIGTDHAYLPIMLHQKNIKCLGTDIHQNALDSAYHNLLEYHLEKDIPLVLTDGLKNLDVSNYNTLVIAGMGYNTIKHILEEKTKLKTINKIIVQSNNDYDKLRYFLNQLDYTLKEEYILEDKNHLYHIMKYLKGKEVLTKEEILFGKFNKEYLNYYQEYLLKLKKILKNIPNNHQEERKKIEEEISLLTNYLTDFSN